ncbi:MAG: hypothetical protein QOH74_1317, partial [Gaiellales bacterium]|nr:hypothetical protein [Gaiellales bacterium]
MDELRDLRVAAGFVRKGVESRAGANLLRDDV